MSPEFLLFMIIGKLLIYLGMEFPLFAESRFKFIRRMFACDLCVGVWIYTGLSFIMGVRLLGDLFYFPVASEIITGGLASFIMHIFSLGWKTKFEVVVIE